MEADDTAPLRPLADLTRVESPVPLDVETVELGGGGHDLAFVGLVALVVAHVVGVLGIVIALCIAVA